jgi:hypothetical protein
MSCSSHSDAQFAAFFIDPRAKWDFEDLDESVRQGITAHFVKKLEDVLAIGFPNLKWKQRIQK